MFTSDIVQMFEVAGSRIQPNKGYQCHEAANHSNPRQDLQNPL